MALSDAKPRASLEQVRLLRAKTWRLATMAGLRRDQYLPFEHEFLRLVGAFSKLGADWTVGAPELALKQLAQLQKAALKYSEAVTQIPRWLRKLVERGQCGKPLSHIPLGFLPPSPATGDLLDIAEQVLATERTAHLATRLVLKAAKAPPTRRKKGGQSKQLDGPNFSASDALVWSVLSVVDRLGGTLIIDKNTGGPLADFFDEARDLLPAGFASSDSRLYRLRRKWLERASKTDNE